jgi:peptidoglycan/xylan/chitin deacetylase (PgdA/CDA1 family)
MSCLTTKLLRAALSTLHYSGLGSLVAPLTRGQGAIFTLHQVLPDPPRSFDPNALLRVTPAFLEAVVVKVRASGFEIVSLDEAVERIIGRTTSDRPFACFTFDDGYRDNLVHAYPVLKRLNVPFTIYVPTEFPDGKGELWWLLLEEVVRRSATVSVQRNGGIESFPCGTPGQKQAAYDSIYWWLRDLPEDRARQVIRELAAAADIDTAVACRNLIMSWGEIRKLAADPLVTIGAHTRRHYAVARLSPDEARAEIAESVARIEAETGRPCRHFSFPYGDETSASARDFEIAASLGLASAVTTRKGLIHGTARDCITGLPRVSVNGNYQRSRYIEVLLTGAPFALWDLFRRAQPASR